jgi:AsmA family protein
LEFIVLHWIKIIAAVFAGLVVFALVAVWLLLSSSLLEGPRGNLTANFLSQKLGQELEIIGGVRIDLGSTVHVVTQGVILPSDMSGISLAEIELLEFDLALADLFKRRINLSNLRVDGAKIKLIVEQDGTSSWSGVAQEIDGKKPATKKEKSKPGVMSFLAGQDINFSNSDILYQDARNGLDLDLLMTSLELSKQDVSTPIVLNGAGTMNGQELTLSGSFPPKQPFNVTADFSQISAKFDGTPDPDGYEAGFALAVSLEIKELAQLLEVLKLEKSITGTGHVKAVIKSSGGVAQIDDVDIAANLDTGQSVIVTGNIAKLGDPSSVTIDTRIRLYPEDKEPATTRILRKLKLLAVDMQLVAVPDAPSQRRMVIRTNGFVMDTSGVGPPPIQFSEVSRTPEGRLKIGKAVLRIGPPEANFLVLEGAIGDALKLREIDIGGTLALPVASLIAPTVFQDSDVLGLVTGGFRLAGTGTELALSDLKAEASDTDLWTLTANGSVKNVLKLLGAALDIEADVPSGAKLLAAMDLEPIETGHVKVSTKLSSAKTKWDSDTTLSVAQSELNIDLNANLDTAQPVVKGQIESDLIEVDQVRNIIKAWLQLRTLNKGAKAEAGESTEQADAESSETTDEDTADAASDAKETGPFRDVTLRPIGQEVLLTGTDIDITIDLRKIVGKEHTSSLTTEIVTKDGVAQFGPMKLEYGNAHFEVSGAMDLKNNPKILKLNGSTGGWSFAKILHELKFKKRASGSLGADFDIAGHTTSVKDFVATLNGTTTMYMRNGSVDSQLLDLAGLGVIPWLFTKKRGPTVPIVCIRAPLYMTDGRITTKQTVVETDQVQLVVFGDVNLQNKTLDINGQPRKIGKPLSRSPWPFTLVGPMAKPKVKVKDGPRRLKRSDGAKTMPKNRKLCVPDILQLK